MKKNDSGFTLIELLVVISILGILSVLAIINIKSIREQSYNALVERTLQDGRTALEAGLGSIDDSGRLASISVIQTNRKGNILDGDANTLVPGLKLPDKIRFMAYYDPSCVAGNCTKHYVYVRHCKTKKTEYYLTQGQGNVFHVDYVAGAGC